MNATELLARLVAFPTVSSDSNLDLLEWVTDLVMHHAPRLRRFPNADGTKANLLMSFGPDLPGGLLLSGHTDVVPVDGQAWSADPWTLRDADGCLTGRGTTDMKGFLACCLVLVPQLSGLQRPLHLAFSYDEEVGCTGVGPMAEAAGATLKPALAVIGEPSLMRLVNAHKGGLIGWATVTGKTGHSSRPGAGVNAVPVAAECIRRFDALAARLRQGPIDPAFDPPWSTTGVNVIQGGEGLNLLAGACRFFWEMRVLPGVDDRALLAELQRGIEAEIVPAMRAVHPSCGVQLDVMARIPALAGAGGTVGRDAGPVRAAGGRLRFGSRHLPGDRHPRRDPRPRQHRAGTPAGRMDRRRAVGGVLGGVGPTGQHILPQLLAGPSKMRAITPNLFGLFVTMSAAPADPTPVLQSLAGLEYSHVYTPASAADPYLDDGPPPPMMLECAFRSIEALEAALSSGSPLATLADGATITHQAMLLRQFPVPRPRPLESCCTYVVTYEGEAVDPHAWLGHYLAHHPPIMARFPSIRAIMVATRIDWRSGLAWPRTHALQRNRVVFDTAEALRAALASPVRDQMRADFNQLPPFHGRVTHFPMDTRVVSVN